MIRGTLLGIVIVCCAAPVLARGPVPPPRFRGGSPAPAPPAAATPAPPAPPAAPAPHILAIDEVVERLIDEATQARAALLLPEGEPDFAARLGQAIPPDVLLPALLTRQHADAFIDAYVRWQLTSFDPDLPDLDDADFTRLMNEAPAMVENPAAAEDVVAAFTQARAADSIAPEDASHLREAWAEVRRRVVIAEAMNRPAVAWRDWIDSKLPTRGPRPRQWTLERCAATVRAGWPPRTIKGRITRDLKASRVDADFTPDRRRHVAAQVEDVAGLTRRFVREVTIRSDGTVHVGFSTAAISRRDAGRWTATLLGEPP